jgi:hypothetical protein
MKTTGWDDLTLRLGILDNERIREPGDFLQIVVTSLTDATGYIYFHHASDAWFSHPSPPLYTHPSDQAFQ